MKLFIDDLRDPPDDSWLVARSSVEALPLMVAALEDGTLKEVSFDHDLGGDDTTRPCAAWLEEVAHTVGPMPLPVVTRIHSANPVGRNWLAGALRRTTLFEG